MRATRLSIAVLIAALLPPLFLSTLAAPPATPANPASAATPSRNWDSLLTDLSSPNYAVRTAAQTRLNEIPRAEIDALRQQATRATDPEVRARLHSRIITMEDEIAFDPLPISLALNRATLAQARAALAKATGVAFSEPYSYQMEKDHLPRISIDRKDIPFWDAIVQMGAQNDLAVHLEGPFSLTASERGGIRRGTKVGGFFAWAQTTTRLSTIYYYQAVPNQQNSLGVRCYVAADPRICLIASNQMRVTFIRNEEGQTIFSSTEKPAKERWEESPGPGWFMDVGLPWNMAPSRKISVLRGEVKAIIGAGEERVEVADFRAVGPALQIGDEVVTISDLVLTNGATGGLSFLAHQRRRRSDLELIPRRPVTMSLVDATGKELCRGLPKNIMNVSLRDVAIKEPIKAVLTMPARQREAIVAFELKDLLIPADWQ